ncbi:MAG: S-layer homology domain-containing protein [Oscillospiraceae bacterium]|nr:S-layer homology domain-containing protein [Oscillospiraceae bacterium]
MKRLNKQWAIKLAALIVTLAMLLPTAAWAADGAPDLDALSETARDTSFFTPRPHTELNYDEIEYEHIDPAPLLKEIDALRALLPEEKNTEEFKARLLTLAGAYERMTAMSFLLDFRLYADSKDEWAAAEYARVQAELVAVEDAFSGLVRDALSSPCAAALDGLLSDGARQKYLEHRDMTDEEKELIAQETALVSEYRSRVVDEYAVTVDGVKYTTDSVYQAYLDDELDYDAYWKIYLDIYRQENAALGEIFVQMVSVRNQIARLNGCGTYAEYAYKATYNRDYTPADAQAFCDAVKKYLVPKCNAYALLYQYPDQSAMPEGVAYSGEGMFGALFPYFAQLSDELLESARYTYEHKAYDVDPAPNKTGTAFSAGIPYYSIPFYFNNAGGDWYDLTRSIHELGHNNETYWNGDEGQWNKAALVYDAAEVHSQALELLMLRFYPELFGGEAEAVATNTVYGLLDVIVQGCLYDEWQRIVYTTPDLTLQKANEIYREKCGAYGVVSADDERTEMYGWIGVPHNFTDPMYYISYATSAAGAFAFWAESKSDYLAAVDDYLRFTALGHDVGFADSFLAVGMESPLTESYLAGLADTIHDELLPVAPYADVYADDWFGAPIIFVSDSALMNGVDSGHFAPDEAATREQSMAILACMYDAREGAAPDTLDEGVAWAIAKGVSDGENRAAVLTREQFAVMLYRCALEEEPEPEAVGDLSGFADAGSVSGWASDAMAWAVGAGIIGGMGDGILAPQGNVTRAQMAAMLMRFADVMQ